MKIQKNKMRGRGMRFILCSFLSILCMTCFGMSVQAGYVSDEHPKAVTSPNGKRWTLVEQLPYYEDYGTFTEDGKHWNKRTYSFWLENGDEIPTGVSVNLPVAGAGQHEYDYPRSGEIPVSKWVVAWDRGKCIHNYYGTGEFGGFSGIQGDVCYNAYWSGLLPYCADCGERLVNAYHYISVEAAKQITSINVDKAYYFMCPHMDEHGGLHLEQTADDYKHTCRAVSYNQYKVKYHKNDNSARGAMLDSYHMYNNATEYEGKPVVPNKYLSLNRYERDGYTFLSWNTEPDGSGQSFRDGQEIYNLTTENYNPKVSDTVGVVTLYAQWGVSTSHLKVDAKGGVYDDGRGKVNGDKTTYERIPYSCSRTLQANRGKKGIKYVT